MQSSLRRRNWRLQTEGLEARNLLTIAGPTLLADLTTTPSTSITSEIVEVGDRVLFVGGNETTGAELLTLTDGDAPTLWRDLVPGADSSAPRDFHRAPDGSYGLFYAGTGEHGAIWHTDGETVRPIMPAAGNEELRILDVSDAGAYLVRYRETYYVAGDSEQLISDIWFVSANHGHPAYLRSFSASDDEGGIAYASHAIRNDGVLVFQHCVDEDEECTVWRTDGTYEGTEPLLELDYDTDITAVDDRFYFRDDAQQWLAYDGQQLAAATVSPALDRWWVQDEDLFYSFPNSDTSSNHRQLAVFDGIDGEAQTLVDQVAWERGLWVTDSQVFALLRRDRSTSADELWVTDGTPAGTSLVFDAEDLGNGYVRYLAHGREEIYWQVTEDDALSIWASDGSAVGTRMIAEYDRQSAIAARVVGDRLWITADSTSGRQIDIFADDVLVAELNDTWSGTNGSGNVQLHTFADQKVLQADEGIWLADAQLTELTPIVDTSASPTQSISGSFVAADNIWYTIRDFTPDFGRPSYLWLSDGGLSDDRPLEQLAPELAGRPVLEGIVYQNALVFAVEGPVDSAVAAEVWISDGTATGTTRLLEMPTGYRSGTLRVDGEQIYFASPASEPRTPDDWWVSDGTPAGTSPTTPENVPPDEWVFEANGFQYTAPAYGEPLRYEHSDGRTGQIYGSVFPESALQVGHDVYYIGYEPIDRDYFLYRIIPGTPVYEPEVERYFDRPVVYGTLAAADNDLIVVLDDAFYGAEPWRVPITHDLDFNRDGVTCADAARLQWAISAGRDAADYVYLDVNADSQLDALDLDSWARRTGFAGDVNTDGAVDAADLNQLALHWQRTARNGWCDGDLDGNGTVGPADLNQLALQWAPASTAAAATTRTPRAPLARRVVLPAVTPNDGSSMSPSGRMDLPDCRVGGQRLPRAAAPPAVDQVLARVAPTDWSLSRPASPTHRTPAEPAEVTDQALATLTPPDWHQRA